MEAQERTDRDMARNEFRRQVARVGQHGMLDVTEFARYAGLDVPVILSADVWNHCVAVPVHAPPHEEPAARLAQLLATLFRRAEGSHGTATVRFTVPIDNNGGGASDIRLIAVGREIPTPGEIVVLVFLDREG